MAVVVSWEDFSFGEGAAGLLVFCLPLFEAILKVIITITDIGFSLNESSQLELQKVSLRN